MMFSWFWIWITTFCFLFYLLAKSKLAHGCWFWYITACAFVYPTSQRNCCSREYANAPSTLLISCGHFPQRPVSLIVFPPPTARRRWPTPCRSYWSWRWPWREVERTHLHRSSQRWWVRGPASLSSTPTPTISASRVCRRLCLSNQTSSETILLNSIVLKFIYKLFSAAVNYYLHCSFLLSSLWLNSRAIKFEYIVSVWTISRGHKPLWRFSNSRHEMQYPHRLQLFATYFILLVSFGLIQEFPKI